MSSNKKDEQKIDNGLSYELNGWIYISVKGTPRERGYAYGFLCAKEFKLIQQMLEFNCYHSFGETWDFFIDATKTDFAPKIKEFFPEFYEEIEGIAEGCNAGGTKTSVYEIMAWNNQFTLFDSWYGSKYNGNVSVNRTGSREGGGGQPDRCSAFIAVGDYTEDGKIVAAHNSFSEFLDGQFMRVILDVNPDTYDSKKGNRMLFQTCACWIFSGTDFFVTSAGIIGTEVTFGGFTSYEKNHPIAFRSRKVMQYGKTLDECAEIFLDGNSGDYANAWFLGDIHKNEIMRLELGLKYHNIQKKTNGFFIGYNCAEDPRIRNKECVNSGYSDIRRHQGSRQVRLKDLMEENKGKINIDIAMKIISDHYDVYLEKENPCSRTVCSHYDLDAREYMSQSDRPKPFQAHGALDGCVIDSTMAQNMSFMARYGNSCGMPFIADEFFDKHRQWDYLKPYIFDRPSQPWTRFSITHREKKGKTRESTTRQPKDSFRYNKIRLMKVKKTKKGRLGKKITMKNKYIGK
jgi:hypothetical protein